MVKDALQSRIAELMYDHDCVIVPGFGGFIANYKAAFIHPRVQLVSPPSKQLSFNRSLKRNDGLLANYISEKEGVTYESALDFIERTVKSYEQELRSGNRLELSKIGILYLDRELKLRFIPDEETNFLKSSFGLPVLNLDPIAIVDVPIVNINQNKKSTIRPWVAAAVLLPLALVASLSFNGFFEGKEYDVASLNPFRGQSVISNYNPSIERNITEVHSELLNLESAILNAGDAATISLNLQTEDNLHSEIIVRINETIEPEPVSSVSTIGNPGLFFLVAGAFEIEENASKLVNTLKQEGFDASIIGKRGRLHLVSYGAYTSSDSANSALNNLKQNNRSAWVYHK